MIASEIVSARDRATMTPGRVREGAGSMRALNALASAKIELASAPKRGLMGRHERGGLLPTSKKDWAICGGRAEPLDNASHGHYDAVQSI